MRHGGTTHTLLGGCRKTSISLQWNWFFDRLSGMIAVLLAFMWCTPAPCLAAQFKVIKVYDGDTVKVSGLGKRLRVRLVAIDAPEQGQPYADASRKHLADLLLHKRIQIIDYGKDSSKRLLAEVFLAGKNISIEMLTAGLAEVYRGRLPEDLDIRPYVVAEEDARTAKRGIWSQGKKYVSPLRWRRLRRMHRYKSGQSHGPPIESPP